MYVHQFYLLAIWSIPHLYIYILYGLLFALLVLGIYSAVSVCMCMLVSNGSYIYLTVTVTQNLVLCLASLRARRCNIIIL